MGLFLKRVLDITVAASLLLLLSPLLLVLALLIRIKLGKPVLFRQLRIGHHGQPFYMVKFRTMMETRGPDGQFLPDEQRMPPFSHWIRSTSLDELPELWNILTGKMSLVGPRPLLPEYLPFYTEAELHRHDMRPGITGLAQISGRNGLTWDDRFKLDVAYVQNFSFTYDLWILWRTFKVVLKREGISAEGHVTMQRLDVERANRQDKE